MSKFRDWDVHEIKLTDENYIDDCKIFYENLWTDYKQFAEKSNSKENEGKEISKIKSPFTVLDGKWGSGKTFFIEKFISHFDEIKDKNNEKFQDYIYIDSLEILEDDLLIYEVLYNILSKTKRFENFTKNSIKKIAELGFNFLAGFVNGSPLPAEIEKKQFKTKVDVEEEISRGAAAFPKKTIVIIDNLERIGYDAKRIISLIYKLKILFF